MSKFTATDVNELAAYVRGEYTAETVEESLPFWTDAVGDAMVELGLNKADARVSAAFVMARFAEYREANRQQSNGG